MRYLIDGHNLIGQSLDLSLDDPDDEARLVERLRGAMGRLNARCTVIFDRGLPGGHSRDLSSASVEVVFAHGGTSADAIIRERLRNATAPAQMTLVTADQELIAAARRQRVPVLSPADFWAKSAARSAGRRPDGAEPNPHVSPREINEWLALFGEESDGD